MISSASRGLPFSPSREDIAPSCICAPSVREVSSGWLAMIASHVRA